MTGVGANTIINNYHDGDHDYEPVLELLFQSNPDTILPVLKWQDSLVKYL